MNNILSLDQDIVTRLFYVIDALCKSIYPNLLSNGKNADGFKIHIVIDNEGNNLHIVITLGNPSDKNQDIVKKLLKVLSGIVVVDGGYQSKPLEQELSQQGITFIPGLRKTTRQIVTLLYDKLRRLRQLIETVNGEIKYRRGCVSSLPRSENGYYWRYI